MNRQASLQIDARVAHGTASQTNNRSPLDAIAQLGTNLSSAILARDALPKYTPRASDSELGQDGQHREDYQRKRDRHQSSRAQLSQERAPLLQSPALSSSKYNAISRGTSGSIGPSAVTLSSAHHGSVVRSSSMRAYGATSDSRWNDSSPSSSTIPSQPKSYKDFLKKSPSTSAPKALSPNTSNRSKSYLVEVESDDASENAQSDNRKRRDPKINEIKDSINSVHGMVSGVMDKIMNRGENVGKLRDSADRLENVSHVFRRNGQVAETEAWVQKVKAASLAELIFFMVVIVGSGLAFLLFLMFIERLLFSPGAIRPPGTSPPIGGAPPPPQPVPPPYCQPYPQQPAPGGPPASPPPSIPPAAPPQGTVGMIGISPGVIQAMNVFVFMVVMVYLGRRMARRPKRSEEGRRRRRDIEEEEEEEYN